MHLDFSCGYSTRLSNLVWTAFPKLETFRIFGLCPGEDGATTQVIDSFFTGFSPQVCSKFESDGTCNTALKLCPRPIFFKRTMPYIGDCKNLKEFKIHFGEKLDSKFVSEVTALHGFQEVHHRTKMIFCFYSNWSVEETKETRRHLDPVSSFVEIQMEPRDT